MEEETQEEEIESVLPFVVTERSPYKASVVANTLLDDDIVHISAQSFGSLATIESKKVQ